MITFFVDGDPKGQPRPRAFSRNGMARVYDPGTAEGWKSQIALAARSLIAQPIEGAIELEIVLFFRRPKGHFRTGKNAHLLRECSPLAHTAKPDADNAAKACMDALTVLGAWKDDAQVAKLCVRKLYGERPGAEITISEMETLYV